MQLGVFAERYFSGDPGTAIIKLRQFAELLSKTIAAHHALYRDERETFEETLRRLSYERIITREIADVFHSLRKPRRGAGGLFSRGRCPSHRTRPRRMRSGQRGLAFRSMSGRVHLAVANAYRSCLPCDLLRLAIKPMGRGLPLRIIADRPIATQNSNSFIY